jgi:AAA family ATP:ADP antiporter
LLFTTTSTFVYFQQAHIVSAAFDSPAERTRVFALINLIVGLLTLGVQWFVTGRFMARFGVGRSAAFLPLVVAAGFLALAVSPVLAVLIAFQSIRRASNFAISKPAREVLFTVVGREEKYKSKNFIDTVVYRGGDAVSGWAYAALSGLGLGLSGIAVVSVPLALGWAWVALALGKKQEKLADSG